MVNVITTKFMSIWFRSSWFFKNHLVSSKNHTYLLLWSLFYLTLDWQKIYVLRIIKKSFDNLLKRDRFSIGIWIEKWYFRFSSIIKSQDMGNIVNSCGLIPSPSQTSISQPTAIIRNSSISSSVSKGNHHILFRFLFCFYFL